MKSFCSVVALVVFALSGIVHAQSYPVKPIKLIVPIPPGGGSPDMVARLFSLKVAPELGQPVVVENRTGTNGNIAAQVVAQSAPDGYTILVAPDTLMTVNPYLYAKTSFDTQKDFVPIATISANRFILSVTPSLPIKTFPDFIEYAKKANPPLAYGSGGNGSQHHLTMEMLKVRAGIELLHVPYKGGTPAAVATASGETAAAFSGTSVIPLLNSGKLRPIAVAGKTRSAFFPDLPAIAEFYPGFDATSWQGLFVPTGTPDPIIVRLRNETNKFLALADTKEKYKSAGGLEPFLTSPAEFSELLRSEHARYSKLVKDLGIVAQ
jgi:tripartite-type tricarboxylate transporter receptor subunit TctC